VYRSPGRPESGDLDDVQQLLVDLVAAGANEIEGVDFDVSAKADLRAEARRQAVAAARNKAGLYAEAAGARLGPVMHIDDVDPENTGVERYRARGVGGQASAEDLAPGHVVVSAAVIVGFSIAVAAGRGVRRGHAHPPPPVIVPP
jgi:uncharacterized protein